jgi:hypothetical protein
VLRDITAAPPDSPPVAATLGPQAAIAAQRATLRDAMPRLTSLSTTAVPGLPDTSISLMPVTALVGPRGSGKSRILAAISWLLCGSPELSHAPLPADVRVEGSIGAKVRGRPIARTASSAPAGSLPRCLLLPARERIAASEPGPAGRADLSPSEAMAAWIEERWRSGESGGVLLIEEPELDLNPQAQRYLYRVMRAYGERNQVIYSSTRSASFVDAVHHMEIIRLDIGTTGLSVRRAPVDLLTDDRKAAPRRRVRPRARRDVLRQLGCAR